MIFLQSHKRNSNMRTSILKGFLPWLIFFAFVDGTLLGLKIGVIGGLLCLLILNRNSIKRRFILDLATLTIFIFLLVIGVYLQQPVIIKYAILIGYTALTLTCFLSLIMKKPFTLQYARLSVHKLFWNNPLLLRVNTRITLAWMLIFLLNTLTISIFYFGTGSKLWMEQIIPTTLIVIGLLFMITFADAYKKRALGKEGVASFEGLSKIQHVKIGKTHIGYRTYGKGSLLILAHGYRMNMHMWPPAFLKKLGQNFELLIFDYPNIGYSYCKKISFTVETIADLISQMIEKLNLNPLALIGYSMGGAITQTFASNYAKKIKAMILIASNTGGKNALLCDEKTIEKFRKIPDTTEEKPQKFTEFLALLFPESVIPRIKETIQKIYMPAFLEGKPISSEIIEEENRLLEHWYTDNTNFEHLQKLSLPALIITGLQDKLVPPENSEQLNKVLQNSQITTYDDAGHGILYQYSFDAADTITEFLNKIP